MATNGRKYGFSGSITSAATKTIWGIAGTTAVRPRICELWMSSVAAPGDVASEWLVQRFTAAGTSTAVVPTPLEPSDPAASSPCGKNHSAEPTYSPTVGLLDIAVNQRSTVRWFSIDGGEFVAPATTANGIGNQCAAVSTGVATIGHVFFLE